MLNHCSTAILVCPKVPWNSYTLLFSTICGWIQKPFDLQVAHIGGFDLLYKVVWFVSSYLSDRRGWFQAKFWILTNLPDCWNLSIFYCRFLMTVFLILSNNFVWFSGLNQPHILVSLVSLSKTKQNVCLWALGSWKSFSDQNHVWK